MPFHAVHRCQFLGLPLLFGNARLRYLHVRSIGSKQLHQLLHIGSVARAPVAYSVLFQTAQKRPLPLLLHYDPVRIVHSCTDWKHSAHAEQASCEWLGL